MARLHTDSQPENIVSFRGKLQKMSGDFSKRDVTAMKFLCSDIIPRSKMEKITKGIAIFDELENRCKISSSDCRFLAELLFRCGRRDMIRRNMGMDPREVEQRICETGDPGSFLSKYRILLHKIANEVPLKDLDMLKFMFKEDFSARELESVIDLYDLIKLLESHEMITESDVGALINIVQTLNRLDLVDEIQRYTMYTVSSREQMDDNPLKTHPQSYLAQQLLQSQQKSLSAAQGQIQHQRQSEIQLQGRDDTQSPDQGYIQHPGQGHIQYLDQSETHLQGQGDIQNPGQGYIAHQGHGHIQYPGHDHIQHQGQSQHQHNQGQGQMQHEVPQDECRSPVQASDDNSGDPPPHLVNQYVPGLPVPPGPEEQVTPRSDSLEVHITSVDLEETNQLGHVTDDLQQDTAHVPASGQASVRRVPHRDIEREVGASAVPAYKMTANPRGYCIIINNEKFNARGKSKKLDDRPGSKKDEDKLVDTFTKRGFKVKCHRDKTVQEMQSILESVANFDHSNKDALVVCILSHGIQGELYGVDGECLSISRIIRRFNSIRCPNLAGKPKIFFLQACQGHDRVRASKLQRDGPAETAEDADIFVGFATLPGKVSYRHEDNGTWYIQTLVRKLEQFSEEEDLLSIMTTVNEGVLEHTDDRREGENYKQMPLPYTTLTKKVFLKLVRPDKGQPRSRDTRPM